jgi:hypothetical protein
VWTAGYRARGDHSDGAEVLVPDPESRLLALLGTAPPPSVRALPGDSQDSLADVIQDARDRQASSLQRAFAATLRHVPFPLRGVVKKMLLG